MDSAYKGFNALWDQFETLMGNVNPLLLASTIFAQHAELKDNTAIHVPMEKFLSMENVFQHVLNRTLIRMELVSNATLNVVLVKGAAINAQHVGRICTLKTS